MKSIPYFGNSYRHIGFRSGRESRIVAGMKNTRIKRVSKQNLAIKKQCHGNEAKHAACIMLMFPKLTLLNVVSSLCSLFRPDSSVFKRIPLYLYLHKQRRSSVRTDSACFKNRFM